jgi:hypothetical protein
VSGKWSVVSGQWSVVSGQWSVSGFQGSGVRGKAKTQIHTDGLSWSAKTQRVRRELRRAFGGPPNAAGQRPALPQGSGPPAFAWLPPSFLELRRGKPA